MLRDAGYPIDDAQHEIELIQVRAFDAAARLADATGDNTAVRTYLRCRKRTRTRCAFPCRESSSWRAGDALGRRWRGRVGLLVPIG